MHITRPFLIRPTIALFSVVLTWTAVASAQPEGGQSQPEEAAAAEAGEEAGPTGEPVNPEDTGLGPGTADTAAAEALFQLGKALMDSGQVDQACEKLAASMEAEPAGGTLLNLALCHQHQGKLASAWAEYRKASELIDAAGQKERADEAMRLALDLESKLSKLTIVVTKPVPGLRVARDGVALSSAIRGVAVPVNPGVHRIEASAPGHLGWSSTVTVGAEGDRKSVTIPALQPSEAAARPHVDPGAGPATVAGAADYRVPYFTGIIMAALGGTSVGLGAVLGGVAASEVGDAESDPGLCGPDKLCTPEGQDVIDGARRKATAATLLIGVGAATVVSGFVLVLTTGTFRSDSVDEDGAQSAGVPRLVPTLGPGQAGLALIGLF